jgi:ribosomal protein S18 acetylase RimI-like enzyme
VASLTIVIWLFRASRPLLPFTQERFLGIQIRQADLTNPEHASGLLSVLDSYAGDEMGGAAPLAPDVRQRLVPALLEQPNALVLLALDAESIVGIAICFFGFSTFAARPLLNVHDLAVLPASRGRGAGRALLEAAAQRARARGCAKLTLEVREDNARARGLYASVGFKDFELAGASHRTLFLAKALAGEP